MALTQAIFGPSKNFEVSVATVVLDSVTGAKPLFVPGGDFLLGAAYERLGPDLLLSDDARSVLVKGYFTFELPPDLYNSEGTAVIEGSLASRLSGPIAPGQFAQVGVVKLGPAIGQVDKIDGRAFLTRLDGQNVLAEKGTKIFSGDVVETQSDASIGIKFLDDTSFALGESGRMVIDTMIYDPSANTGKSTFNIVQGVFSFVSGEVAKFGDDAMVVKTPVATIGIRGTTVAGKAAAEGSANTITLLPDADGGVGQIAVSNGAGIQLMSAPFQTTNILSAFVAPAAPIILPASQIQNLYGNINKSLPPARTAPQQRNSDNEDEAGPATEAPTPGEGEGPPGEGERPPGEGERPPGEGEGPPGEGERPPGEGERPPGEGERPPGEGEGPPGEGERPPGEGPVGEGEGNRSRPGDPGEREREPDRNADAREAFDKAREEGLSDEEAFEQAASAYGATDEEKQIGEQAFKQALSEGLSEREALFRAEDSVREKYDGRNELKLEIDVAANALRQATADGSSVKDAIAQQIGGSKYSDTGFRIVEDAFISSIDNAFRNNDGIALKSLLGSPSGGGSAADQAFKSALLSGKSIGDAFGAAFDASLSSTRGADGRVDFLEADLRVQGFNPNERAIARVRQQLDEIRIANDLGEGTIQDFDETVFATPDPDALVGRPGNVNTSFVFTLGSTLGGIESVDGRGGFDDFTIENLSNFLSLGTFVEGSPSVFQTTTADGSITGTLTATNLQQFNFKTAAGTNQALGGASDFSGLGAVVVGTSDNDTLDISKDGTSAADITFGNLGLNTDQADFFGAIIFGGDGDDTLGTSGGGKGDALFGGAGNDTFLIKVGPDKAVGGAGDDTFVFRTEADFFPPDSSNKATEISGEGNSSTGDTLQIGDASTSDGQTFNAQVENTRSLTVTGIENLNFFASDTIFQAQGSTFDQFQNITGEADVSGVTLRSARQTLNLTDISVSSAVSTLTGISISVGEGVEIFDSSLDSIGRTLIGSSDADVLNGRGGDDILQGRGAGSSFDTLAGGDGDDRFEILASSDITGGLALTGGNGTDTLAVVSIDISSLSFPSNNVTLSTLETFDLDGGASGGVTVTIDADVLEDVAKIQGDGPNDTLNLFVNSFSLTNSSELSGIETINLTNTNQTQTVEFSSGTTVSGLNTIRGTVNSSSVVDDQITIGGDFDFRGITLTNIDTINLGENSTRQTIDVGATTSFGLAEVTGFDVGAGSTTDIFDFQSGLRSGNNTSVSATDLDLNVITEAGRDDVISASSSGVFAFQFGVGTADHLNINLSSSTLSQITSAAQASLESNLTISGDQVTQGQDNTDILLLFNGSDGRDTVIIRYEEGSTSEESFANELSVVAIFNDTINDFNDANIV